MSNKTKWIYALSTLFILLSLSLACIGGGGGNDEAISCVVITNVKCSSAYSGTDVTGLVKNICSQELQYVKIVSELYDQNGQLLETDEEYIENLKYSEQLSFRSPMRTPPGQVESCRARVDDADFMP